MVLRISAPETFSASFAPENKWLFRKPLLLGPEGLCLFLVGFMEGTMPVPKGESNFGG